MARQKRKGIRKKGNYYCYRLRKEGKEKLIRLGRTRHEAEMEYDRLLRSGQLDSSTAISNITIKQATEEWLERRIRRVKNADQQRRRGRTEKGYRDARARAENYLYGHCGHLKLSEFNEANCSDYSEWVQSHDIELGTIKYILGDLKAMLSWCTKTGRIVRSPVPDGYLPIEKRKKPKQLTPAETEIVVGLPDPLGFVCRLLLGTGLRWGEACRAKVEDLRKVRDKTGQELTVIHVDGKNGSWREVPVPSSLVKEIVDRSALSLVVTETRPDRAEKIPCLECGKEFGQLTKHLARKHHISTAMYRMKHGEDTPLISPAAKHRHSSSQKKRRKKSRDYIFPYADSSYGSIMRMIKDQSGVSRFTNHRLRHTFANNFMDDGGDIKVLSQVMGHADVATTQIYAEVSTDIVRRESLRVAKIRSEREGDVAVSGLACL
jgi:integrase